MKRVVIFFAVIIFFIFAPFFLKGQIPFPGNYLLAWYEPWKAEFSVNGVPTIIHKPVVDDTFRHLYPLRLLATESLKKLEWPLWNPYNGAGTPLMAITHPGFFNPLNLFYFFLMPPIAWSWYVIFQVIILGISTYIYCRALRLSCQASLFSATVLSLSGFVIVRLEYAQFVYVLSALPLLLTAVELVRSNKDSWTVAAIPILTLLTIVSGQPQAVVYVLGFFAIYSLARLWQRWILLIKLALAAILGVGLAAFQLLPAFELYTLSTITRESSRFIFATFLLPWSHLVTILIPNYFGNQATYNYFITGHDYVETAAYLGLIPVFLALLALTGKKLQTTPVIFLAAASIILPLTTLNWFGARWFFSLPIPILSADVPARIFMLSTFTLSVLAGFGFEQWLKTKAFQKRSAPTIAVYLILIVIVVGVTIFLWLGKLPCPTPRIPDCRLVSLRNTAIETSVFTLFLAGFLSYIYGKKKQVKRAIIYVPVILVLIIGVYNADKFLPFSPVSSIFPQTQVLSALQGISGLDRFFGIGQADFRANITTQFRLFSPEYFDPLHVRRYAELINFSNTGDSRAELSRSDVLIDNVATPSAAAAKRRERLLDLLSVKYLVFSKEEMPLVIPDTAIWQDQYWYIRQRETALPRAFFVTRFEVEKNDGQLLKRLFTPNFDPYNQVILEEALDIPLSTVTKGTAKINKYESNQISLRVDTTGSAILILTDTDYPGWQATIDGVATKIYRADYTFRAVVVPRGVHLINFTYQPESLRWGITVSILSGVSFLVLLFWI